MATLGKDEVREIKNIWMSKLETLDPGEIQPYLKS